MNHSDLSRRRVSTGIGTSLICALFSGLLGCPTSPSPGTDGGPDSGADAGLSQCLPLDAGQPPNLPFTGLPSDGGYLITQTGIPAGTTLDNAGNGLSYFAYGFLWADCDYLSRCAPTAGYQVNECITNEAALQPFNVFDFTTWTTTGTTTLGIGFQLPAPLFSYEVGAVDAGRQTFHQDQAAACLAAPFACNAFGGRNPDRCLQPVFTGNVADGGACQDLGDCVAGLTCDLDGGSAGVCQPSGTQTPHALSCLTAGCGGDPTLACDIDVGYCLPADAGLGQPCQIFRKDCQRGYFCENTQGGSGTCQPQVALGQPCTGLDALVESAFHNDSLRECQGLAVCAGASQLADGGIVMGKCQAWSDVGGPCVIPPPSQFSGVNGIGGVDQTSLTGCLSGLTCSCGICVPPPTSGACATSGTQCRTDVATCVSDGGAGFLCQ